MDVADVRVYKGRGKRWYVIVWDIAQNRTAHRCMDVYEASEMAEAILGRKLWFYHYWCSTKDNPLL